MTCEMLRVSAFGTIQLATPELAPINSHGPPLLALYATMSVRKSCRESGEEEELNKSTHSPSKDGKINASRTLTMDRPTHPNLPGSEQGGGGGDDEEAVELVLFHANECYVYLIPPRKSAASYRADEWNVNKWAWEGVLKVVSKGKECIIRLEDKTSGELYARAFLREGEPHPVEPVIDSSRYFVLRVEENIGGRKRHAFIGIGFRERTEAYDFQAALHDHMKYLDKKKVAEEMEQHYQTTSTVDYSLKEGETLVLQLKNKGGQKVKSACLEQSLNNLSLDGKTKTQEGSICLKPPPPPPAPLSPVKPAERSSFTSEPSTTEDTELHSKVELSPKETSKNIESSAQNAIDDDFGDFQAAG
nr:PREDICTED: uncharacterized protein At1g03900 isoform X1 [Musa acuminata subsp. malaccensis]